jgi:hypothetical protein
MAERRTRCGGVPARLVLTRRALEDALQAAARFGRLSGQPSVLDLEQRP